MIHRDATRMAWQQAVKGGESATSPERGKQLQQAGQVKRAAVSPDEAALMVGLSRSRIYQLIGSGELRSIKVGRRRLVPMSAISELLGEAA